MTEFKKNLFITTRTISLLMFQLFIKHQAQTMQKRQPFWLTQYPNSLAHFHSLHQVELNWKKKWTILVE